MGFENSLKYLEIPFPLLLSPLIEMCSLPSAIILKSVALLYWKTVSLMLLDKLVGEAISDLSYKTKDQLMTEIIQVLRAKAKVGSD